MRGVVAPAAAEADGVGQIDCATAPPSEWVGQLVRPVGLTARWYVPDAPSNYDKAALYLAAERFELAKAPKPAKADQDQLNQVKQQEQKLQQQQEQQTQQLELEGVPEAQAQQQVQQQTASQQQKLDQQKQAASSPTTDTRITDLQNAVKK